MGLNSTESLFSGRQVVTSFTMVTFYNVIFRLFSRIWLLSSRKSSVFFSAYQKSIKCTNAYEWEPDGKKYIKKRQSISSISPEHIFMSNLRFYSQGLGQTVLNCSNLKKTVMKLLSLITKCAFVRKKCRLSKSKGFLKVGT